VGPNKKNLLPNEVEPQSNFIPYPFNDEDGPGGKGKHLKRVWEEQKPYGEKKKKED
jgi:hypothetical protein